jgi:hypothetical protein
MDSMKQVEWGVYCENFVMIGLTADAGDHFKKRVSIPLAPCTFNYRFMRMVVDMMMQTLGDKSKNNRSLF